RSSRDRPSAAAIRGDAEARQQQRDVGVPVAERHVQRDLPEENLAVVLTCLEDQSVLAWLDLVSKAHDAPVGVGACRSDELTTLCLETNTHAACRSPRRRVEDMRR